MKKKFYIIISVIILCGIVSCKKSTGVSGQISNLTLQEFKDARKGIQPFGSFDTGFKKLTKKIGQPYKTEGKKYYWYAKDEKSCIEFFIEEISNNMIGGDGIYSNGPETELFKNCPAK